MGLRRASKRLRRWLTQPARGGVDLGDLARPTPISRVFGLDRGLPVDRHYIEAFLGAHAGEIRGRVLEIADARYTQRYGAERVTRSDVLHPVPGNRRATLIGNLETGEGLESGAYDALIVTQTLQYVFDLPAAFRHLHRILAPGGTLLLTVPGISQLSRPDESAWGEHWRFTRASAERLLSAVFPPDAITAEAHGNVLAAIAFLEGLAVEDLAPGSLDADDPEYPLLITARAVKP